MSRFSKQSDLYATYRPDYPEELYAFIFEHLNNHHRAWDCATGSGQVARVLAESFDEIIATDISTEQLNHAPEIPNINYREASAENSGLPDNHVDLITVGQALHWFDFESFYSEVRRVAKSNALFAPFGYGMLRISPAINPIIDDLYQEAFGTYYNENRSYIDNSYQTIPFPFKEIGSPEFEHSLEWTIEQLEGYFNSWSAVQKLKDEQDFNPVTKTIQTLQKQLPDQEKIKVTFPIFLRIGKL